MIIVLKIFTFCYYLILSSSIILYYITYKKTKDKWLKIIFYYLVGLLLIQVGTDVIGKIGYSNTFLSHVFFLFQFTSIGMLYLKLLEKYKYQRQFIKLYMTATVLIMSISYLLVPKSFLNYNLLEIILTNYIMIIGPLMYFYSTLTKKRKQFYLNIGILFYGILSSSVQLYLNILVTYKVEDVLALWYLNYIILIVFQIIILIQILHTIYTTRKLTYESAI